MSNKQEVSYREIEFAKFQAIGSDSSIAKLLRSQPDLNENVIRKICNDVTYADLSALNMEDLELFGVNDKSKQSQLVSEFSTLTNQEESLKRFMNGLKAHEYQEKIHCHVRNQLNAIALILEAIEEHSGSNWNNILVKPNVYISVAILRALEEISAHSTAMKFKKSNHQFKWIFGGVILGLFAFAAKKML